MNTWLITSRELRSFFTTWMGYIIVFASLVINGILFNTYAIGSEPEMRDDLAAPVDDRVFFAGEATHPEHSATAHGAYMSGVRAAGEIQGKS